MAFLIHDNATPTKAKVMVIHNFPDDLSEDVLNTGIFVNSIVAEPAPQVGKMPVFYVNPTTKENWYEFIDRPLTDSERLVQLESDSANTNYVLMMGGFI